MSKPDSARGGSFLIWATLPPCAENLDLLVEISGVAEPLIDLRFGTAPYRSRLIERALAARLPGLTVCADPGDPLLKPLLESPPQRQV